MADTLLTPEGKVTGPRGAKGYKKWIPKEWRPEYEAIVALSCTGLGNEEVGRRFGYGKQQVSNILNTPQARKMRELINIRLREANTNTLAERMDRMNDAALKHVEYILTTPTEAFKNPMAIFDRSLAFLKSSGVVRGESVQQSQNVTNIQQNIKTAMILPHSSTNLLSEGLNKANEVMILHDGTIGHNAESGKLNGPGLIKGTPEGS